MRTTVDLPDALLDQIRPRLKAEGRTLREAVIEGLRRTMLDGDAGQAFSLRDAAFDGAVGFADGFDGDVTAAIHADAQPRLAAEGGDGYQP